MGVFLRLGLDGWQAQAYTDKEAGEFSITSLVSSIGAGISPGGSTSGCARTGAHEGSGNESMDRTKGI